LKSLALLVGFVLALLQIAMQEGGSGMVKGNLRAALPTASQPAGENQNSETEPYGLVLPLSFVWAATAFPPPMQPICIFNMLNMK
jgi:hypothetical protein